EGLSLSEVNHLLIERLRVVLEGEIRRLDPEIPTILLGHLMADNARYGAERFLAVGKGFTIPLSLLTRPCFDYVALGHVHRHQILCEEPLIVYPGSIERVDFSEEKEDKGFILLEVEPGRTRMEFCPLSVRAFRTIEVDVSEAEDPQSVLLQAIQPQAVQDAVVRLLYHLRADQLDQIDSGAVHEALSAAHSYTIHPELVSQLARPRMPELGVGSSIDPLEALKTYLANREDLRDIELDLIAAAHSLLNRETDDWLNSTPKSLVTVGIKGDRSLNLDDLNQKSNPEAESQADLELPSPVTITQTDTQLRLL
ncbi:MAG: exonuclease SbcCD subunit D, partial [Leptolyngbyaceae bacterium]|nr:exonuclease SbcCD subunit D [Leptolyngbyaceae bacterium]